MFISDFFLNFAHRKNTNAIMKKNGNDAFEYQGITYTKIEYEGVADSLQCEYCDLKVGGKKLCLSNRCKCGECGKFDDCKYVFKAQNVSEEYRKNLDKLNLEYKNELLEKEIASLKKYKKSLVCRINELSRENGLLMRKINKHVTLVNNVRSSIKALIGEV